MSQIKIIKQFSAIILKCTFHYHFSDIIIIQQFYYYYADFNDVTKLNKENVFMMRQQKEKISKETKTAFSKV